MSRNRPPRIEPKLRRPSRSARSDWRGNINQPQQKPKRTIGQKPHKWHNSFLLERREKSDTPFETRFFLFAAWDEAKKYRERRPVFGTIAQILIVIAFIGVFVF